MQISDKIALLRRQKGLTQEQLAEILEVSRQAVYKWETGASVPELDKIKKLAQYFSISFDALLDDSLDIDTGVREVPSGGETPPSTPAEEPHYHLRPVFLSSYRIAHKYIDITHGYYGNVEAKNPNANTIFSAFEMEAQVYFTGRSYETIRLIPVAPLYLYVDRETATIGIVFDGVHQFVCPFENLVDCTILQEGAEFKVDIAYRDLESTVRHYCFDFDYYFNYALLNEEVRTTEALQRLRVEIKGIIRERLAAMKDKILVCKLDGEPYLSGRVAPPAFDAVACYQSLCRVYEERKERERELKRQEQAAEAARRKRDEEELLAKVKAMNEAKYRKQQKIKKILLISLIAVVALVLVIVLATTISSCSKKAALRKEAQSVVDMIDALDGVTITLDHADELTAISDAYKALSPEAREYVINWTDYQAYEMAYPNYSLTTQDLIGTWESDERIIYIEKEDAHIVIVKVKIKETDMIFLSNKKGIAYNPTMYYNSAKHKMIGNIYDSDSQRNWGFEYTLSYDAAGELVLTNAKTGETFRPVT